MLSKQEKFNMTEYLLDDKYIVSTDVRGAWEYAKEGYKVVRVSDNKEMFKEYVTIHTNHRESDR